MRQPFTHFRSVSTGEAEQCLVDADTCTDSSSCKIGSSSYCCNAGYVVHAVSMNGELVTCACNQESGSNTGYRCTIRSDESGGVSVTSASWLTCALTLLFALMSV